MRRLGVVVAALVLLSVVEILVLIAIGQVIGLGWALLLLLITSVIGGSLLRSQGSGAWRVFRADLQAGNPPGHSAIDGLLVIVGGVLMLVPGFVTDFVGLLILLPMTRGLPRAMLMRIIANNLSPAAATSLFGPRRVRARSGAARQSDADTPPVADQGRVGPQRTAAIEGEIIEPER